MGADEFKTINREPGMPEDRKLDRGKAQTVSPSMQLIFSEGMKKKWDKRVYVELLRRAPVTAGSGATRKGYPGHPRQWALSAEQPFDKYMFCEALPEESEKLEGASPAPLHRQTLIAYDRGGGLRQQRCPIFSAKYP